MRCTLMTRFALVAALAAASSAAQAETFDLATATDLYTPSFRGEANTTWVGWDMFGDPTTTVINDTTPDIGTDGGSFVTNNGEDHQSGSLNYYVAGGSVAEDVTFDTAGVDGSGFTTIIVQAKTLFGGWSNDIEFGPIDGVDPTQVLLADNAAGGAQLFAKYEMPGTAGTDTFSISSGPFSHNSMDLFVVDTYWSPNGFAAVNAVATPEPTAAVLASLGLIAAFRRR